MATPSETPPEGSVQGSIRDTYEGLASSYDRVTRRLKLIGYHDEGYRREVVGALNLQPGATVVELGCGTGANHGAVLRRIGPTGHLVAIDLTAAMLDQARARARQNGWENIEFVRGDAATVEFAGGVDAVFSTFVLAFLPDCGAVVRRACQALKPDGRWAIGDQKVPSWGQGVIIPAYAALTRRYGISREMIERQPWRAVREAMQAELVEVCWRERYLGFAYVAWGHRGVASG